jgi:carbon-monoxide dehydrogenase medium subunit
VKFRYLKPKTIEEALTLKKSYENSKFIAGGTDIFVLIKKKVISPDVLISLRNITELSGIKEENDNVIIKSSTTLRDIETSEIIKKYFPALYDALINMASIQIRNVGTIGGNICNASPAADTASPLLIYDAKVKVIDFKLSEKIYNLKDFFTGVKSTKLDKDELLTEFILKKPETRASAYYKFMKRRAMDLANVGVAVKLDIENNKIMDTRVALSTVAPKPIRAYKTEEFLKNKEFSEELLNEAGEIAKNECSPIDDIRGLAWHKREIVKAYLKRVALTAYKRI